MAWAGVEDARRHFSDAGLRPTSLTWLHGVHRVTAPLRWRWLDSYPRFFAITWEAP